MIRPLATLLLLLTAGTASVPDSVYTDLAEDRCKTIRIDEETGSSEQRCPGTAGYNLLVLDDDDRMSVTVVTPDGREHPLDYWSVVTTAFSSLGEKAEWRVVQKKPVALIVRVKSADPEMELPVSSLAVAKITPQAICVTDVILSSPTANEEARRAADSAADRPCKVEAQ
jgi:hypothetical protein